MLVRRVKVSVPVAVNAASVLVHSTRPLSQLVNVNFSVPHGQTLSNLPVDSTNGKHYITAGGAADDTPPRRIYEDGSESIDRAFLQTSIEEVIVDPNVRDAMRASEPSTFTSPI